MLHAFLLGLLESRGDVGLTFDGSPDSPRSRAYDRGRSLGQWLQGIS